MLELVNEIRGKVNRECGDWSVSCADILALATRDAIVLVRFRSVPSHNQSMRRIQTLLRPNLVERVIPESFRAFEDSLSLSPLSESVK